MTSCQDKNYCTYKKVLTYGVFSRLESYINALWNFRKSVALSTSYQVYIYEY